YYKNKSWIDCNLLCIFDSSNDHEILILMEGLKNYSSYPPAELFLRIKNSLIHAIKIFPEDSDRYWNLLLYGWFIKKKISGKYLITDREFHDIIISVDEDKRRALLWTINSYFRKDCKHPEDEYKKVGLFFQNVWPKQKLVNTSATTDQIIDLMMSNVKLFNPVYKATKHCLEKLDSSMALLDFNKNVLEKYHLEVFALLYKLLPYDKKLWPYKVEDVLKELGKFKKVANDNNYQMFMQNMTSKGSI
ncbi:MAG: hypothetical protein LUD38_16985, partial [Parabacteroides sp.]|nr:hypothetical protein [Parabacteroides sp.]